MPGQSLATAKMKNATLNLTEAISFQSKFLTHELDQVKIDIIKIY